MSETENPAARRASMVERQIAARGIDDPQILGAFTKVPRERFVPDRLSDSAYEDGPLPIGEGQTISQPYIVARMIDIADIGPGDRVLEVGAGSGYAAAVISRIVAQVFAVERHEVLAREAKRRVAELGYTNCTVLAGDGMKGLCDHAPFDAILVAARCEEVPRPLKEQLAIGGRLVVPVGGEDMQQLRCIRRVGQDRWESEDITSVRFVPLVRGTVTSNEEKPGRDLSLPELIAESCTPLPEIDGPDFAAAFDRFADKRVVMLGESSHGTAEFYAARAVITRRLVERHGFSIIAVEADWPDAAAYNRYIRGEAAPEDPAPPFQRFPTWMWRNTVMPGFLKELRAINAGRNEDERVGFYGLDLYNMSGSIAAILSYLDAHDPEAAAVARERYGCLTPWQSDPAMYGRSAITTGFAQCEEAVVQQCRDLLERAVEEGGQSFSAAMNARLVASAEQYYRAMYYGGSESWNLRDSHMADTLEHLLEYRGSEAKAVVWAHNSHIGDARATEMGMTRGEHNIGQLARERWGDDAVALIGFGTHAGTVSAAHDWDGDRKTMRINPSREDSYERLCHDSDVPRFLLDLSRGTTVAERLSDPRLERFIGVIYRPETERWSHYTEAVLSRQFDAFCWFDETRALAPLEDHEPDRRGSDTYPFGI
ncbi:protein-L-isoaspartate(D-aspartate) O-methyltransferase [Aurantiacibacter poecillastricola]|uniref:protein-L-isoaspartate(D-aspartate) O-methyltransferase n=1 Tax=Aurantiacibacter poecillastricola TaxID=3064385 RepID=UPI00273E8837|nr:protein-L-isoaspartate(D-aspartate) O-methyltransferase [Aurantiacibacter sp. 219JJ12-13]MDP5263240.1 protein-L-isoaspartate(D-aspartate) O-methyltransferase [Aurantiacibacter sp. 219JJ12-13]